jgi:hypothetical protein
MMVPVDEAAEASQKFRNIRSRITASVIKAGYLLTSSPSPFIAGFR